MEMDIGGRTSPFEIVEPVCIYSAPAETSSTVCNIKERLSYEHVVDLLTNTADELCTCWPPSKPKNGDVFLFIYQEEKQHFDFVADGMNWRNQGTRLYSKNGTVVKKRYYQRRIGKDAVEFKKCVYEISGITRVLIHYFGKRDEELPEAPHGNRKKHLDKAHIRVMPSVLANIHGRKEAVGDIYMKMVAECRVPAQNFKVAMPRNMKQVENTKQYDKKLEMVEKCDVDEVYSLLELNTELSGFIKYLAFVPSLNVVLINEQLLQEWSEIAMTGERCLVSYVTRLKFRDIYISVLVAQQHQFEGDPGAPLAWLLHHRNTAPSYKLLLREVRELAPVIDSENIIMVGEKEREIHDAWREMMKNTQQFICWESLKRTVIHRLKKQKVTAAQKKNYLEDISTLLLSKTDDEYDGLYEDLKQAWSHEFTAVFDTELYDEMKGSIRGSLMAQRTYTQDTGISVVECEGLSTVLQDVSLCHDPGLDGVTLAMYMLGSFYQCQIAKSYSSSSSTASNAASHWKLKPEHRGLMRDDFALQLPSGAAHPSEIVKIVVSKLEMSE